MWLSLVFVSLLAAAPAPSPKEAAPWGTLVTPADSLQAIVVIPKEGSKTQATVAFVQRESATSPWRTSTGPVEAVIGVNGFAPAGEKREGDGRTPAGTYPLESAFGIAKKVETKLPYRRTTDKDLWIDDPESPDYNKWVKAPTKAKSFERMKRKDALYELGIVVGYNTSPVEKSLGSAIFFHVWRAPTSATAGCVAMAKEDLLQMVQALDPAKKPVAVFNATP